MITNLISITKIPPIYPESYVSESLLGRVKEVCPDLPVEKHEQFLLDLFQIDSIDHLIDSAEIVSIYEYQPAVSYEELTVLANRISTLLTQYAFHTVSEYKFMVRNVLNTVPRDADDLVDYITPEQLESINFSYAMHLDTSRTGYPEGRLYVREISNLEDGYKSVSGMLAMKIFQEVEIEKLPGITHRQKMLAKAAEYWVLSQYGDHTASLWLARFINPISFCTCTNVDCNVRHFGFADPRGCADLVLQSLTKIRNGIINAKTSIAVEDDVTVSDIVSGNIEMCLYAAEGIILIDEERLEADNIRQLLATVHSMIEMLSDILTIRAIFVIEVFSNLYKNNELDSVGITAEYIINSRQASVGMFHNYFDDPNSDYQRDSDHNFLFDAYSFLSMSANKGESVEAGLLKQTKFVETYYSSAKFREFKGVLKEELESSNGDLSTDAESLYLGFLTNYTNILALKSIVNSPHANDIMSFITKDNLDEYENRKVVNYLSDFGQPKAMKIRLANTSSATEKEYWQNRLAS